MNDFDIHKAYGEMARMCNLIVAVISGDVSDGMTKINRYINSSDMTKEDGLEVLRETGTFDCPDLITEKQHEENIEFFESLLRKICACPPDNIHFSYIWKDFRERVRKSFNEYYGLMPNNDI